SRLEVYLTVWPRDPEAHRLAARAARLTGDLPGCEAHLEEAIRLHGGATEAVQLEYLLLRVQTGRVDEVAPALFDSVDKRHPETPVILETLSRAYMDRLRYQAAFACLSRWIEDNPPTPKPFHWRGCVWERLEN